MKNSRKVRSTSVRAYKCPRRKSQELKCPGRQCPWRKSRALVSAGANVWAQLSRGMCQELKCHRFLHIIGHFFGNFRHLGWWWCGTEPPVVRIGVQYRTRYPPSTCYTMMMTPKHLLMNYWVSTKNLEQNRHFRNAKKLIVLGDASINILKYQYSLQPVLTQKISSPKNTTKLNLKAQIGRSYCYYFYVHIGVYVVSVYPSLVGSSCATVFFIIVHFL